MCVGSLASGCLFSKFPNNEILFDFNEGSSGDFKDPSDVLTGSWRAAVSSRHRAVLWYIQYLVNLTFKTIHEIDKKHGILHFS